jgi:hypothetical protein
MPSTRSTAEPRRFRHFLLGTIVLLGLGLPTHHAAAQSTPTVFNFCYIKGTGTTYRVNVPGTPDGCTGNSHTPFSWVDGLNALLVGATAGGDLSGTFPNPSVSKLAGVGLSSTAPTSGQVLTFNGTNWAPAAPANDATAIHTGDAAGGDLGGTFPNPNVSKLRGTGVSGTAPTNGQVLAYNGTNWTPTTPPPAIFGIVSSLFSNSLTSATGASAIAMGQNAHANADFSVVIGGGATADGKAGSIVIGDGFAAFPPVKPSAPNQFVVRAVGGTTIYSQWVNVGLAGVSLASGGGAWASISDVRRKNHFRDVDADSVLAKIARMPVREWSYKAQDSTVRHMGPTAQDFYAAFKLDRSDTTITTTDIDGVALVAIKALERRTAELRERTARVASLEARVNDLERRLAQLLDAAMSGRQLERR